jgi:hypothetical protein
MNSDHARGNQNRSRQAGAVFFLLVFCVEIYVIAGRAVELPRTPLTADSFLVDGLSRGVGVTQTMTVRAGGFNEVAFSVAPIGTVHAGKLNWSLREIQRVAYAGTVRSEERFLYRGVVRAQAVFKTGELVLTFPVIDESNGRSYRLDIWPVDVRAQNGIGLWATDGSWNDGGSMFVNGLSGYSEFVFEARAARVTVWDRLRHHFGGLGFVAFLLLTACAHAALFAVLWILAVPSPLETDNTAL